jgi:methyl-accepting chemotaxis protein
MKNIKIGTKLYGGFIVVLLLTIGVGTIAYFGITNIVYQTEISKNVNRIIVDAGDAQAGSLRYIIYNDEKYYDIVKEESANITKLAEEVRGLLLSNANRQAAASISEAIAKYEKANIDYYTLHQKQLESSKKRDDAALRATKEIIDAIAAAKAYSGTHKFDYSAVERVFMVQEARNAINRARIAANKYTANPTDEYKKQLHSEIKSTQKLLEEAKTLMASEETKIQINDAMAAIEVFDKEFDKFDNYTQKQNEINTTQRESATELLTLARTLRDGVNDYIAKTETNALTLLLIVAIIAVVLGLTTGTVITRGITIPLARSVDFADKISRGDLTSELNIEQKDEIGKLANALKNMSGRLKDIVSNIFTGAENIASASQEMSSTSQEMSQGSNEQASSAEEVSSSMEEMTANIQQNTDNARQTESIAQKAAKDIKEGSESVDLTVTSMKEIAEKITIVSEIARQTNILALNAAVEAARAGEHGKGFAVVASEVRKLAERSQIAANEINELSSSSVNIAEKSGKMLASIVPDIQKTAQLVQEINASSVEQSSGANQVNDAIQQLNQVTQQNAAASEEMATSSEELASQADQLKELVSFFNIGQLNGKQRTPNKSYHYNGNGNGNGYHGSNGNGQEFNYEKIDNKQILKNFNINSGNGNGHHSSNGNGHHSSNGNGNGHYSSNGNGNGHYSSNGNGNGHYRNGNGNGNGGAKIVLHPKDNLDNEFERF